jgi:hypothetical protein
VEIAWALPCRFAEATPDGTATLVGAGIDSLWVPDTPADVGVFLMMRIAGAAYEFEEEHRLSVALIDPERDEEELLSFGFGPMPEPPPQAQPGLDVGILVPAAVGWAAEHLGIYTLDIRVDDRPKRSIAIQIRSTEELEQTQVRAVEQHAPVCRGGGELGVDAAGHRLGRLRQPQRVEDHGVLACSGST